MVKPQPERSFRKNTRAPDPWIASRICYEPLGGQQFQNDTAFFGFLQRPCRLHGRVACRSAKSPARPPVKRSAGGRVLFGGGAESERAISLAGDRPLYPNLSKTRLGFRVTSTDRAGLAGDAVLKPRFPATSEVAFDVRASLNRLPFAVARLRLCARFPVRRALLPGP